MGWNVPKLTNFNIPVRSQREKAMQHPSTYAGHQQDMGVIPKFSPNVHVIPEFADNLPTLDFAISSPNIPPLKRTEPIGAVQDFKMVLNSPASDFQQPAKDLSSPIHLTMTMKRQNFDATNRIHTQAPTNIPLVRVSKSYNLYLV
jgi:hypothetical protein